MRRRPHRPPPRPDARRLRAEIVRLAQAMRQSAQNPREWARLLRDRHQRGERLTPAQVESYKGALDGRRMPDSSVDSFVEEVA
jgi:hypothetical protein